MNLACEKVSSILRRFPDGYLSGVGADDGSTLMAASRNPTCGNRVHHYGYLAVTTAGDPFSTSHRRPDRLRRAAAPELLGEGQGFALIRDLATKFPITHLLGHSEVMKFQDHPYYLERDPTYHKTKRDPGLQFMSRVHALVEDLKLAGPSHWRPRGPPFLARRAASSENGRVG
jgi:hypothetical protein